MDPPDDLSDDLPDDVLDDLPDDVLDDVLDDVSDDLLDDVSDDVSDDDSDRRRARLSAQSIETATAALTTAPSRHVAAWRSSYEG